MDVKLKKRKKEEHAAKGSEIGYSSEQKKRKKGNKCKLGFYLFKLKVAG